MEVFIYRKEPRVQRAIVLYLLFYFYLQKSLEFKRAIILHLLFIYYVYLEKTG
jgi:hypothetical protein